MKTLITLTLMLWLNGPMAQAASPADIGEQEAMIAGGQASQLAKTMTERLKHDQQDPQAYYWLARAELAQIDSASVFRKMSLARSGKNHLEKAIELDPQLIAAREALASYYLEAPAIAGGSEAAARQQAEALMELDPASGYRVKSAIAASEEDYNAAVDLLRQALAADTWSWQRQYEIVTLAVHRQTDQLPALLDEAQTHVQAQADEPGMFLPLLDYQRGKFAATTGRELEAGHAALSRYLQHTPREGEPGLQWAEFRLAQVERQMGLLTEAQTRLQQLESAELPEDLAFALNDERRWNFED